MRGQRTYESERNEEPEQHHHRQAASDDDEDQTVLSNEQLEGGLAALAVASVRVPWIRWILAGDSTVDRYRIHPGLRLVLVLEHAAGDRDVHRAAVITSTPFRVGVVGVAVNSAAFVLSERVVEKWSR